MKKGFDSLLKRLSEDRGDSNKYWIERLVDDYLVKSKDRPIVFNEFHASSAGTCRRLLQLSMSGVVKDKPNPNMQRIFDVGKHVHLRYGEYFKKSGNLVNSEVFCRIAFNEGFLVIGSADFILMDFEGNKRIIELKSMNTSRFNELLINDVPIENNFLQWNIYSEGLNIREGDIVYENKDNQKIKGFSVKFDQDKYDRVISEFKMIFNYNKMDKLVPKPEICLDSRYCIAKYICEKE